MTAPGRVPSDTSSVFDDMAGTLRQWQFRGPLRIKAVRRPRVAPAELEQVCRQLAHALEGSSRPVGHSFTPDLVAGLVTTFWRLEGQVAGMAESSESRTFRTRLRQLNNLMKSHDIQVYDYSGRAFDPDELWDDVVADETRKVAPIIVSMREPRIVYRGSMLQRGTPIVEDRAIEGGHE